MNLPIAGIIVLAAVSSATECTAAGFPQKQRRSGESQTHAAAIC
jgi:hypothetical protein